MIETDLYVLTASELFHVPVQEVTWEQRRSAKELSLGVMYGMGAQKDMLAHKLQVDDEDGSHKKENNDAD